MKLLVTGSAGFIGSCVAAYFKKQNYQVIGCDFPENLQNNYLASIRLAELVSNGDASIFNLNVDGIIHIGAITDTAETDWAKLAKWNIEFSMKLWEMALKKNIPFVYASSGATYGDGRKGFSDSHEKIFDLEPLNLYGKSKQDFDCWALKQSKAPKNWYGLKFFNVFGPNEYHKNLMASVVFRGFQEINQNKIHKLYRSHRPGIKDGEQKRDFIYVKDILNIIDFLLKKRPESGIYNSGTGKARTFLDLSSAIFSSLNLEQKIEWVDTPQQYREHYQYFTQAEMKKLKAVGYDKNFHSLEEAISDYVKNYLVSGLKTYSG